MKKLQLLTIASMLLLSAQMNADVIKINNLNLNNPDVRKCLKEASAQEGWDLKSIYTNSDDKLVFVFSKGKDDKVYISK
ncbi:hypothetical protein APS56_10320 [Pseudalgibacter alginicilyticus]|uniref:Uncharacterized protein n=2 Tax=Pseudalgibacter alginicilyticus TaxID=1736674 RepID=A0A0P0D5U2_9FLAO|nr:hypothetical protein APS56_10320 [Pseudalgibacter alginicilyticus]